MHAKPFLVALMFIVIASVFMAGCALSPTPRPADIETARETLITFFSLLHDQRYGEALCYYSGSLDVLRDWNPAVAEDKATLLKSACTLRGLQCLTIRAVLREEQVTPTEFRFLVQFTNEDGSLFTRGPCCGATETQMPTQSQFPFTVKQVDDRFLVQEMPVYVP